MALRSDILSLTIDVNSAEARRQVEQFVGTVQGAQVKATPALSGMTSGFGALKAGIAGLGIGVAISQLSQYLDKAQHIQEVSKSFEFLGKQYGFNEQALRRLGDATDHEITRVDLMERANHAMQLGLIRSAAEFIDLAAAAENLGDAVGIDAARAIEIVTTGMARMSDRSLAQLGILLDTKRIYEDYAKQLNTTAEKLTEAEQRTAFMAAALEQMTTKAKAAGDESLTFSSMWIKAITSVKDEMDKLLHAINKLPEDIRRDVQAGGNSLMGFLGEVLFGTGNKLATMMQHPGGISGGFGAVRQFEAQFGGIAAGASAGPNVRSEPPIPFPHFDPVFMNNRMLQRLRPDASEFTGTKMYGIQPDELDEIARTHEQAQQRILGLRMDFAEQWSKIAEQTEIAQIEAEYERVIEARKILGQDTAEVVAQEQEHITAIEEQYAQQRIKLAEMEAARKRALQISFAQDAVHLLGVIFGQNKAIAIASAIVNTAEGVTRALAAYPPPYSFAMAALVSAAGAAQIRAITSAHIGGGGGGHSSMGAVASGGGGTSLSPSQQIGGGGGAKPMKITVDLNGLGFVQDVNELARTLGKAIEEQFGRAGSIVFVGSD